VSGDPELVADHPVRLIHPRTGQPLLFVTQLHAHRIHQLDADQSDRLLARLFGHMYAPERVYEHRWRPHDFLLWDNLAIQHARPKTAELSDGVRSLQRVTISDSPLSEIIDRARWHTERRVQVPL
jgi:taurine dioxygenase